MSVFSRLDQIVRAGRCGMPFTSLLVVVLVAACGLSAADDPLVTLEQGTLRGKSMTSRGGRNFSAFQGVPYAAPPVGDLRFKGPQAAAGWPGERLAQAEGAACPQSDWIIMKAGSGQEDCLYLNVFTPQLDREGAGLSVMVWVHGGGFFTGSSNSNSFGPDFLLDHDIILVTFNYRLGALGFLSLGTPEAPGNYGLKDQVAALRWVQNNVAKFGGNPDSVTIFGESAGGASIHYLMLSPLARGLFHRAIAQSGSANNNWAFSQDAANLGQEVASRLGCEDPSARLTCLRGFDKERFLEINLSLMTDKKKPRVFVPSSEPAETEGAFLTEDPRSMLARGDIADVPFMAGLVTHEGLMGLGMISARNLTVEEGLTSRFARVVNELLLPQDSPHLLAAENEIREFYESHNPGDLTEQYVLLSSDSMFNLGVDDLVRGVAALNRSPVFYYQFSYDGGLGILKPVMRVQYNGTIHTDELGYLFSGSAYPELQSASPADQLTIERVTKLWTDFAKTGNSTPNEELGVRWDPVDAPLNEPKMATTRYLDIGEELVMKEGNLNGERVAFWQKLREKYQSTEPRQENSMK